MTSHSLLMSTALNLRRCDPVLGCTYMSEPTTALPEPRVTSAGGSGPLPHSIVDNEIYLWISMARVSKQEPQLYCHLPGMPPECQRGGMRSHMLMELDTFYVDTVGHSFTVSQQMFWQDIEETSFLVCCFAHSGIGEFFWCSGIISQTHSDRLLSSDRMGSKLLCRHPYLYQSLRVVWEAEKNPLWQRQGDKSCVLLHQGG